MVPDATLFQWSVPVVRDERTLEGPDRTMQTKVSVADSDKNQANIQIL
jgi:hypothetical protein